MIAEVFPDPHGPITELDVDCHDCSKCSVKNKAKLFRSRVSAEGVSMGVSDHVGLLLKQSGCGSGVGRFCIVLALILIRGVIPLVDRELVNYIGMSIGVIVVNMMVTEPIFVGQSFDV